MSDKEMHIPNLHPSHRATTSNSQDEYEDTPELGSSFKSRIGSFVGSYSRASLMHMAENVVVSDGGMTDDEDDNASVYSSYLPRYTQSISRRNSEGTIHERTPLFPSLQKVDTCGSVMTVADNYPHETHAKSSFTQSIFNSINILIGVGILALPLGFKCAGWAVGLFVFAFCFGLTNYTAKLLAKCLSADPESRTYGDMGAFAFGIRGRIFISVLFLTELITCSVALVVLLSDGIDSLFPGHDPILIRVISFFILTPTLFIPVRHLSYTSLLGILSVFSLLFVIIYDGLSKPTAPGSLHEMADTSILPQDWMTVPMSFGLIMAGFAGHAVFPTIYRDMKSPKRYNEMVNYTYLVTAFVYMTIAACGYAMFGSSTMQEITQNIVLVPEYNQMINRLAVWLIALNPIAKYGLTLNPVVLSWQIGLSNNQTIENWFSRSSYRKPMVMTLGVIFTSAFIVLLAYLVPNFDQLMSLLGALFSFVISGIFPMMCHLRLFGHTLSRFEIVSTYILITIAAFMAISGTLRSII
ncbi:transmembrane amino acid transporter protein-domain-containing protein [Helicostylum pulchrum]|nr:transmembrane amino acid transporter protein-domain-containing protein [Helicostylum pulchrum]